MNPPAPGPLSSPSTPRPGPRLRDLKGRAQLLEPLLHVGRAGITPALVAALDGALRAHALVKIRFTEHKEDRKRLAAVLAQRTGSRLVQQVGHVAVYYRARPSSPACSPGSDGPESFGNRPPRRAPRSDASPAQPFDQHPGKP